MDQNRERQSTPVGNLTSKIAHSLSPEGSIQSRSERDSLPATLPKQRSPQTGTQAGGHGALTLSSSLRSMLSGADAWSTDKALIASLPQPVRSRLKSKVNNDFDIIGYDLAEAAGNQVEVREALAIVSAACSPAPANVTLAEVTKCFAVTTAREHDETDMKATLAGMVDGLREFPEDVIRDACRAYARCHKWRPSLSELREFCWPRFRARESLRSVLRRAAA